MSMKICIIKVQVEPFLLYILTRGRFPLRNFKYVPQHFIHKINYLTGSTWYITIYQLFLNFVERLFVVPLFVEVAVLNNSGGALLGGTPNDFSNERAASMGVLP